jgi:hypothetical protein
MTKLARDRWGGLAAFLAGGLWIVSTFVGGMDARMQAAALALSLGGVVTLLTRRSAVLGWIGLTAAWLLAVATVMTLAGIMMFLRLPWSLPASLGTSFVLGLILLTLSLILLAVGGWHRRFLPRWTTAAMLIGALGSLLLWAAFWNVEESIFGRILLDVLIGLFPSGAQPLWAGTGVAWLALGAGLWFGGRTLSKAQHSSWPT